MTRQRYTYTDGACWRLAPVHVLLSPETKTHYHHNFAAILFGEVHCFDKLQHGLSSKITLSDPDWVVLIILCSHHNS